MKRLSQRVAHVRESLARSVGSSNSRRAEDEDGDEGDDGEESQVLELLPLEDVEEEEEEELQGNQTDDADAAAAVAAKELEEEAARQEDARAQMEANIEAWANEEEGVNLEEQERRSWLAADLVRCTREPEEFDEKVYIIEQLRLISEALPFISDLVNKHQLDTFAKFKSVREWDLEDYGVDDWKARRSIAAAARKWSRGEDLNLSLEALTSLPDGPLELFANVNLSSSKLTKLPEDLCVHGKLNIAFSSRLRKLPARLHVDGDLAAERCVRLREICEELHVSGSLVLKRCEALERLPLRMEVLTNLVLASCKSLTALPDNMHIRGNLDLKRCESLEALPGGLQVDGRLTLRYSKVRELPEDVVLNGDLDIADCDGFNLCEGFSLGGTLLVDEWTFGDDFPRHLHVGGSLDLEIFSLECLPPLRVDGTLRLGSSLREIEGPLHVGTHLLLMSCSASLPRGTIVDGKVELVRCHGRRELRGLQVGSALVLQSCSRIKDIDDIDLKGSLNIEYCHSFERFGSNVKVNGGVLIRNCYKFRELPENWKVSSLHIVGTSLSDLPSGLHVDGLLRVSSCPLTRLPDDIQVDGNVEILCDIEYLPASLCTVNGDLEIVSSVIEALPSPLRVTQSLRVSQCPKLERLDGDLRVGKDILADRCVELVTLLPDNFHALGTVSAVGCPKLERVGAHLQVEGDLNLHEAVSLKALDDVYVGRSLSLSRCTALERLGNNVQTGLDLSLGWCTALTQLPRVVKTAGVFTLHGCSSLETLDVELDIGWDLDLRGTAVSRLPSRGRVRGDLLAENLKIVELPANLAIDGHISLRGCTLLERIQLPWSSVYSIDLSNTKVTSLPDNLRIKGDLLLCHNDLESLPSGLRVEGLLNITGCRKLRMIPDDLAVGKSILANGCVLLASLPSKLRVQSDLSLVNATSLAALPEELEVAGHLDCSGCSALWTAGSQLTVYQNCSFAMCVSLSALPDELYVGGDLDCFGCASIEVLPAEMYVGVSLFLTECIGISSLPASILRWGPTPSGGRHTIDLTGTSIFEDRIVELRQEAASSVNLLVTRPNASPERNFTNLRTAVMFWFAKAGASALQSAGVESSEDEESVSEDVHLAEPEPEEAVVVEEEEEEEEEEQEEEEEEAATTMVDIDADAALAAEIADEENREMPEENAGHVENEEVADNGHGKEEEEEEEAQILAQSQQLASEVENVVPKISLRGVLLFLSKLTVAKEYKREDLRESLARRVVDVLRLLVDEEDARDELLTRMGDSVDACGDKPIQALNQMAVIVRTVNARGNREALRELAVGIARLQVVQRHAQMKVDSFQRPVDEVVIFLRFEVVLAGELNLPVPAADQLFPHFVLVTDEELNAARDEALQITGHGEAFETWLSHWSEWQRQMRLEAAKELSFERLKRNSRRFSLSWTDLFGNRMADPVRIGANSSIWGLQDLLKHWDVSEHVKRLASDPLTALVQVQRHVREKGLVDQLTVRDVLLQSLTSLREGAAGTSGTETGPRRVQYAANRVGELSNRIRVLQERLEIVSGIHRDVQTPPGRKRTGSSGRLRRVLQSATGRGQTSPSSPDTLPLGVGQGLDNELISGEVDVDEYALQISRLARTFAELEGASKRKEAREGRSGRE
ncbi:Disease resistance-like protein CSA1 [Hondaea fermentalgiana]|uniref:Disease resistance-like protein CSA1 n=1 Tax=Hondaea fermentalgiana TaxID=2315210 RepID=A0A2R5GWB6_9STRA|nr:Disease resistance-like protein CSA1 [Hondaea fermentalgiana]|eukprot:GBG34058.1 Disease resistance-like protein CSA1 [Hondaea fermentalgiana]